MSVCGHDPLCSGAGWMHDAQVTPEQRSQVGLPEEGEFSMTQAKRLMRAYRKGWGDGFAKGVDFATSELPQVTVQELADDADE